MSLQESRNALRNLLSEEESNRLRILVPSTLVRATRNFRLPVFCPIVQLFQSGMFGKLNPLNETNLGNEPWARGMHRSQRRFRSLRKPRSHRSWRQHD